MKLSVSGEGGLHGFEAFMTVSERVVAKELSLVSSCWLTLMSHEAVSFSTVRAEMLEGSDDDAVTVLS